jgi:hypothetical protein
MQNVFNTHDAIGFRTEKATGIEDQLMILCDRCRLSSIPYRVCAWFSRRLNAAQ